VVVISGDTGSGKTTQVTCFIIEHWESSASIAEAGW
jgi:HrpA-like RNA helicase